MPSVIASEHALAAGALVRAAGHRAGIPILPTRSTKAAHDHDHQHQGAPCHARPGADARASKPPAMGGVLMRILIIGSGIRERVLATALAASSRCDKVLAMAPSVSAVGPVDVIEAEPDPIAVAVAVFKHGIDLVIIDASTPGADTIAAAVAMSGTASIGAGTFATRAVQSRSWTLEFLADNLIPTAPFTVGNDADAAAAHALKMTYPLTITTDQAITGDRPRYCRHPREAVAAINAAAARAGHSREVLLFQPAGFGPEVVWSFWTDGAHWRPMPHCRDWQRRGPGRNWALEAYSPISEIAPGLEQIITDAVIGPFHTALAARRLRHRGAVTLRLALTPAGPKVLDLYPGLTNAHAPLTLPQLRSDPAEILEAVATGRLSELEPTWSGPHLVSLTGTAPAPAIAAPANAAGRSRRDVPGTAVYDGGAASPGGDRHLTVVGTGKDFKTARNRATAGAAWIHHDTTSAAAPATGARA